MEFGAADGLSCSNTAALWHDGWAALLVEADGTLADRAERNAAGHGRVTVMNATVQPPGLGVTIDDLLARSPLAGHDIGYMSVDVDGDDFWIVTGMDARPYVLAVEYNRSVPPHLDLLPAGPGNTFGVGAATMRAAMEQRGYTMVGLTATNLFFVRTEMAGPFADLETDLAVLQPASGFTYAVTDYRGHAAIVGARPPWGLRWPETATRFAPNTPGVLEVDSNDSAEQLMRIVLAEIQRLGNHLEDR